MFLWNGVSLFNTEEKALKSEYTPTATKYTDLAIKDNAIISKIKKLQENVKRQVDVNIKDKTPEVTTVNQKPSQLVSLPNLWKNRQVLIKETMKKLRSLKRIYPLKTNQEKKT